MRVASPPRLHEGNGCLGARYAVGRAQCPPLQWEQGYTVHSDSSQFNYCLLSTVTVYCSPYPPPPGVLMINSSPAFMATFAQPPSFFYFSIGTVNGVLAHLPLPPPLMPAGAMLRCDDKIFASPSVKKRMRLIAPLPPRFLPLPPLPLPKRKFFQTQGIIPFQHFRVGSA